MIKTAMTIASTAIGALAMAPTTAPAQARAPAVQPYTLPRSQVTTITAASGESYRIFVYRPATPPPKRGYPVLYLLDGNESFPIAATVADGIGEYLGYEPGVIVGIGYPGKSRRQFDYTPVVPAGTPILLPSAPPGGADAMLDFIVDRVKPLVEAQLPIDHARQAIAGYSLGGLFAIHAMFTRPDQFQTYIASSASIWFGEKQVLTREAAMLARLPKVAVKPRLILTVGEYEQEPKLAPGAVADERWNRFVSLSRQARTVDNARELAERMRSAGLDASFKIVPGETHATGDYVAIRDALAGAFAKP